MKKLLMIFSAAILAENTAWAINACVAEKPNESLEELLKVVKELKPKDKEFSKDFCWAQHVCQESENYENEESENPIYKFKNQSMPKDFSCEEYDSSVDYYSLKFSCGMTAEEEAAISDYSADAYMCMNAYLRQKSKDKGMDYYIKTMNQALDKLPNYEGVVVRGADLPPKIAAMHKKGSIVTYDAFTSTSTSEIPWGNDHFVIFSKTGKPIMNLSGIKEEYEVLFKSGTKFKVLDVVDREGDKLYIMKEMTCGPGTAQEKKEDEALIQKIKDGKTEIGENWRPDEWACPEEETGKVPLKIKQESLPILDGSGSSYMEEDW